MNNVFDSVSCVQPFVREQNPRWLLMLSLPEPTRILTRLAPNNAAAVMNRIADAVAVDLHRPRVGVREMLNGDHADVKLTPMPQGVMMVDACVDGLDEPYLLLAQLTRPVVFPNGDRRGVVLVAVLFSPDTASVTHLQATSRLARLLGDTELLSMWRAETSTDGVRALFNTPRLDAMHRASIKAA
jgi:hypothetical protein